MEKNYNEDYINGIKFLLKEGKERGINVRRCTWIPHASKMLSEHNLCYKFWRNVVKQKRLNRIFLCNTWYDMLYGNERCLFSWSKTSQGFRFWHSNFDNMLGASIDSVDGDIELRHMKLK